MAQRPTFSFLISFLPFLFFLKILSFFFPLSILVFSLSILFRCVRISKRDLVRRSVRWSVGPLVMLSSKLMKNGLLRVVNDLLLHEETRGARRKEGRGGRRDQGGGGKQTKNGTQSFFSVYLCFYHCYCFRISIIFLFS